MRALIIDDDPVTRLFFAEILAPHADTTAAASGSQGVAAFGLALASGKPFDAVLLDIRMPDMDGHQALQKIRNLEQEAGMTGDSQAAAVMVSSMDDARNVNRAFFQGGAISYLTKPVDPEVLLSELRKFDLIS